jgi:hypothetical protein
MIGLNMSSKKTHTEIDLISRLGCMRRNTVIQDNNMILIEHIELWVPHGSKAVPVANTKKAARDADNANGDA